MSVCRYVTLMYCIQTAKQTFKLFSVPGRPTMVCCFLYSGVTEIQGNPSAGESLKYRGWENFAIFDWNMPWLLWNINRKLWVADRSVSIPMILSDLERRDTMGQIFQGICVISLVTNKFGSIADVWGTCFYRGQRHPNHMGRAPAARPSFWGYPSILMPTPFDVEQLWTNIGLVTHTGEGRVSGVSHTITDCTNASRGLSAIAEFLVLRDVMVLSDSSAVCCRMIPATTSTYCSYVASFS